jgi:hypothetical protein
MNGIIIYMLEIHFSFMKEGGREEGRREERKEGRKQNLVA